MASRKTTSPAACSIVPRSSVLCRGEGARRHHASNGEPDARNRCWWIVLGWSVSCVSLAAPLRPHGRQGRIETEIRQWVWKTLTPARTAASRLAWLDLAATPNKRRVPRLTAGAIADYLRQMANAYLRSRCCRCHQSGRRLGLRPRVDIARSAGCESADGISSSMPSRNNWG